MSIDTAADDSLMGKSIEVARTLLEEMASKIIITSLVKELLRRGLVGGYMELMLWTFLLTRLMPLHSVLTGLGLLL